MSSKIDKEKKRVRNLVRERKKLAKIDSDLKQLDHWQANIEATNVVGDKSKSLRLGLIDAKRDVHEDRRTVVLEKIKELEA